jgi:integrase
VVRERCAGCLGGMAACLSDLERLARPSSPPRALVWPWHCGPTALRTAVEDRSSTRQPRESARGRDKPRSSAGGCAPEARGSPPITFHDLRHTCASLLFQKNVHPKFIQEHLGHASVAITLLDTYSHMLPGMGNEAADGPKLRSPSSCADAPDGRSRTTAARSSGLENIG